MFKKMYRLITLGICSSRPAPAADPEDLVPRPIIKEEDLNRMDDIARDAGWAGQDDIDYK